MKIEFYRDKDAANRVKHGASLELGAAVLRNMVAEEVQWVEGEERYEAFGFVGLTLFVCIYTMRGGNHRIISVRRATRGEETRWLS